MDGTGPGASPLRPASGDAAAWGAPLPAPGAVPAWGQDPDHLGETRPRARLLAGRAGRGPQGVPGLRSGVGAVLRAPRAAGRVGEVLLLRQRHLHGSRALRHVEAAQDVPGGVPYPHLPARLHLGLRDVQARRVPFAHAAAEPPVFCPGRAIGLQSGVRGCCLGRRRHNARPPLEWMFGYGAGRGGACKQRPCEQTCLPRLQQRGRPPLVGDRRGAMRFDKRVWHDE
mmetsp:Transcript_66394/g.210100  ORF Transcript_66394/g.210100 Transcript_66394/m.210100 type:complete len:227 (-) Transcript_66394:1781-2461(-)